MAKIANFLSDTTNKVATKEISRRDFLKGVTAFFAAIGLGGLFSLSQKPKVLEKTKVVEKRDGSAGYGGTAYGV